MEQIFECLFPVQATRAGGSIPQREGGSQQPAGAAETGERGRHVRHSQEAHESTQGCRYVANSRHVLGLCLTNHVVMFNRLHGGFSQDYESKLEALQKQVDSRYLESPEEEEEPEEEGEPVFPSKPF